MKDTRCPRSYSFNESLSTGSVLDLVSEKSKPLREVYDYEMNKFTNLTTFHGLIRWYNGNKKAKIFWTIIIGVAVSCFIYQCSKSWEIFCAKPTATNVEFVSLTNGSDFPDVTICNYNPVKNSALESYNMSTPVLDYIIMAYLQVEDLFASYSFSEVEQFHSEYEIYLRNNPGFSVTEFFMNAGYSCDEMFVQCTFGGLPMNCCEFARPVITDMGKCYHFGNYSSSKWLSRQYISGPYHGFQAFINVSVNEYPTNNLYETGVRIVIHPDKSLAPVGTGGLSCSPGNKLYAGITQTHYSLLLPEKWGKCKNKFNNNDFNSDRTKNLSTGENYMSQYTTNNCEIVCLSQHYIQKCGCLPLRYFDTFTPDIEVCDPRQMYNCTSLLNETLAVDPNYWSKICSNCAVECERRTYSVESSYIKLPINQHNGKILRNRMKMSKQQIQENLVIANVYFSDVNYVRYQQVQSTSLTATLSQMGGNMGLFLGCSLVTCIEILVFLCKVCYGSCLPKRRASVQSKKLMETLNSKTTADLYAISKQNGDGSNPSGSVSFSITDTCSDCADCLQDIGVENTHVSTDLNKKTKSMVLESVYKKFQSYFKKALTFNDKLRSNSTGSIIDDNEQYQTEEPISFISISF